MGRLDYIKDLVCRSTFAKAQLTRGKGEEGMRKDENREGRRESVLRIERGMIVRSNFNIAKW